MPPSAAAPDVDVSIAPNRPTIGYTTGCSALTCDELGALYGGAWRTTTGNARRSPGVRRVRQRLQQDASNLCFGGAAGGATPRTTAGARSTICVAIGSRFALSPSSRLKRPVAPAANTTTSGSGLRICADGHMTAVGGNHCSGETAAAVLL